MFIIRYIILIFIMLFPVSLMAQDNIKKVFTIGVQDFKYYLPYSQYVNNEYIGFNREILDMFATSKGYTFIYKAYPVKRLIYGFLNNTVDFKYPDNSYWNSELKKDSKIIYSNKVLKYIDGVMVLPENKYKGISKLGNLAVAAGFTPYPFFKYINNGQIKVDEVFNYENLLIKGLKNRVGGIYSNISVSQHYLKNFMKKENQLVFDESLPYIKDYRYLSTIKYAKVIEEFNLFLHKYQKEINSLKEKYNLNNYLEVKDIKNNLH